MPLDHLQLTAHHVGCLTENIVQSIEQYKVMGFAGISPVYDISAQNVKVCFIEIRKDFYIELVEFPADSPSLKKIFKSANPYYHIGYMVKDINTALNQLVEEGFHLINQFHSEAFNGKLCAFLYSPEMHMVELIEA